MARNSLGLQSKVEPQICNLDDYPPDQAGHRCDIHKPPKDHGCVLAHIEVDKWQQEAGQSHRIVRCTEPVAFLEEFGRVAIAAKPVQCPRSDEDASGTGTDSRSTDDGVDDRRNYRHSGTLESNDKRGLLRSAC